MTSPARPERATRQWRKWRSYKRKKGLPHNCAALLLSLLWGAMMRCMAGPLRLYLRRRARQKREISPRLAERRGFATLPRPPGPLLWLHAASVGETRAAFGLIETLLETEPDLHCLITTGTCTSARLVEELDTFGKRVLHQFIPLDVPRWCKRFLAYWRPDGCVFLESELWPNLLEVCRQEKLPVMLVNGRLSERSLKRWKRFPGVADWLLERVAWISPATRHDLLGFQKLAGKSSDSGFHPLQAQLLPPLDLKQLAPPLPCSESLLRDFTRRLSLPSSSPSRPARRPVFLAASTHPGEEELIRRSVTLIGQRVPHLLTIIVPRHPQRGPSLSRSLGVPCRTEQPFPAPQDKIWIADTLGELGLYYRLADAVLLGHSLQPSGNGHNPYEPLAFRKPTAVGPWTGSWQTICQSLALPVLRNEAEIADWVTEKLTSPRALSFQNLPSNSTVQAPEHASTQPSTLAELQRMALRILTTISPYRSRNET
ncbi:3-deoxy-D-manno-octulosonic acid transferase [Oecophyllibacter saccharovorans]|nr:3-deoxy-D-manno-octulosonic acid transferase [Oecophyllibacter saccharovorans]